MIEIDMPRPIQVTYLIGDHLRSISGLKDYVIKTMRLKHMLFHLLLNRKIFLFRRAFNRKMKLRNKDLNRNTGQLIGSEQYLDLFHSRVQQYQKLRQIPKEFLLAFSAWNFVYGSLRYLRLPGMPMRALPPVDFSGCPKYLLWRSVSVSFVVPLSSDIRIRRGKIIQSGLYLSS